MGRTVKNRKRIEPKPVQKIELSEDNVRKRAIAAVLFLIIGAALLVYCFVTFITPSAGWATITATQSVNDSGEFVFRYYLGADGTNAKAEERAVAAVYDKASEKVFKLFHDKQGFEDAVSIYEINRKPNTELTVDEALYNVFSLFESFGSRYLYIAPIYSQYENIFYCTDDSMLVDFDPLTSGEVGELYRSYAVYINDPSMIDMQLLGDNKIKLFVSEEYLEFAEEEGITDFIGLSWLTNAFAADIIAEELTKNGFTHGTLSSYDGFTRNLDSSATDYSFNIFDKKENEVYLAASMRYKGPETIVFLKSYALNDADLRHYYRLTGGETRTPYLDVKDGIPKSSLDNLVLYSEEKGCAEILLETLDIYISEELDEKRLNGLSEKGIYSVYSSGFTLLHNDGGLLLDGLYDKDGIVYRAEEVK
ncbi:MAG: hypothetical protein NC394_07690 [Bacteroides sp.]|nr:hypothetical protein [Bacteroides sp.]